MAYCSICRHQHGLDSQERDFIAANEAVLGEFMDCIDRVADQVDKQRMSPSGDTDCADTLRTAVQELRQVQIDLHQRHACNILPVGVLYTCKVMGSFKSFSVESSGASIHV